MNQIKQKSQYLLLLLLLFFFFIFFFLSLICHLRIFQFSLKRMHHLAKLYTFLYEIFAFLYTHLGYCMPWHWKYIHGGCLGHGYLPMGATLPYLLHALALVACPWGAALALAACPWAAALALAVYPYIYIYIYVRFK